MADAPIERDYRGRTIVIDAQGRRVVRQGCQHPGCTMPSACVTEWRGDFVWLCTEHARRA